MKKVIRILILFAVFSENVAAQELQQETGTSTVLQQSGITSLFADAVAKPLDNLMACSFLLPSLEYRFDDHLKHGIFLGFKKVNAQKKCDCSSTMGSLCYVAGATYRAAAGYYPHTQTGDVSLHYGYRYLFVYGELGAGYAFGAKDPIPDQFFHFGPSIGFDLLAVQANAGYSFTTEKINGKSGAFTLSIVFSPESFEGNKEYKKAVKTINKSTATERKSFRIDKG